MPDIDVTHTEVVDLTPADLAEIHDLRCRAADFFAENGDDPPTLESLQADFEDLPDGYTSADEVMYRAYADTGEAPILVAYELCHECGGLCCCLYLAHDEEGGYVGDGWLPAYIEEWLGKFEASGALVPDGAVGYVPGAHGIEPLHDPRLSHLPTAAGEAYRAVLPPWVDTRKCQFCHPDTGCLLPPEYRAPICHEYHCELWPSGGRAGEPR